MSRGLKQNSIVDTKNDKGRFCHLRIRGKLTNAVALAFKETPHVLRLQSFFNTLKWLLRQLSQCLLTSSFKTSCEMCQIGLNDDNSRFLFKCAKQLYVSILSRRPLPLSFFPTPKVKRSNPLHFDLFIYSMDLNLPPFSNLLLKSILRTTWTGKVCIFFAENVYHGVWRGGHVCVRVQSWQFGVACILLRISLSTFDAFTVQPLLLHPAWQRSTFCGLASQVLQGVPLHVLEVSQTRYKRTWNVWNMSSNGGPYLRPQVSRRNSNR